jgi:hypothetical protein
MVMIPLTHQPPSAADFLIRGGSKAAATAR